PAGSDGVQAGVLAVSGIVPDADDVSCGIKPRELVGVLEKLRPGHDGIGVYRQARLLEHRLVPDHAKARPVLQRGNAVDLSTPGEIGPHLGDDLFSQISTDIGVQGYG